LKPKHVATLIVIAGIAMFTVLQVRTCVKERRAANRTAADHEIHTYFEATVKPKLSPPATVEPATLARPILPVVPPHEVGLDRVETQLDLGVYKNLDPAQRTDRVANAGSIVIVERELTGFYAASQAASQTVSTSAVVTVFDVKSRSVTGKLVVEVAQQPEPEATQQMIDDYRDMFDGMIVTHLQALPPAAR
jgi:hypothetical protein